MSSVNCTNEMLENFNKDISNLKLGKKKSRCVAIFFEKDGTEKDNTYVAISGYNFRTVKSRDKHKYYNLSDDKFAEGIVFTSGEWEKVFKVVSEIFKDDAVNLKKVNLHMKTPTIFLDCEYFYGLCYGKHMLKQETLFDDYFYKYNVNKKNILKVSEPCFSFNVKRLFSCAERKLDKTMRRTTDYSLKKLIISKEMCNLCEPFRTKWESNNVIVID